MSFRCLQGEMSESPRPQVAHVGGGCCTCETDVAATAVAEDYTLVPRPEEIRDNKDVAELRPTFLCVTCSK